MQLEHEFVVPVPVEQAWAVLLDVERVAPCMPGATVDAFDGETVTGRVKVKVGPIQVTYSGQAKFVEKDEAGRRVVLEASGREMRGSGTASATVESRMDGEGTSTRVTVTTDLAITGKPAQFGRGVMVEVGNKLIGIFADCLAQEISGQAAPSVAAAAAAPAAGAATAPAAGTSGGAEATAGSGSAGRPPAEVTPMPTPLQREPSTEAIDLLGTAGLPVLKRVAPVLVGLVALFLVWRLVRRR